MKKTILLVLVGLFFIMYIINSNGIGHQANIENFTLESSIYNNMKNKYKRNKKKALMLKEDFTGNLEHKIKQMVRRYKL